jgi:phage terminase small subunit
MSAVETQAAPKPKRHRSRKFSAEPLVGAINENELGPAMLALNERQRRFVFELQHGPTGYGSEVRAVRAAGYVGADATLRVTAHRILHSPSVQNALREVGYRMIRAASFGAIRNVETIANDLKHHDCLKANLALLDRGGFAIETVHNVKVAHEHQHQVTINAEQALERIRQLAARAGLDTKMLPPAIDLTAEEVDDAAQ